MSTRRVNAAAELIRRSMENGRKTPAGWALDLESAQLLQSPEVAAELEGLRARVAELEAEKERWRKTAYRLAGEAGLVPRESADGITRRFAPTQAVREDVSPQVEKLRALLTGQRAAVEDPHDSPLHHTYRVGRDLPETGGDGRG